MKNTLRAYPLITIDPYFSYWAFTDKLNKGNVKHWTGKETPIYGDIIIDNEAYRFLGKGKNLINQVKRIVTPLITSYVFKNDIAELKLSFWSPMFLEDPTLFSRPCSYIDYEVNVLDGKKHDIKIEFSFDESFVYDKKPDSIIVGDTLKDDNLSLGYLTKKKQPLLELSGDDLRINWGYLLLAINKNNGSVTFNKGDKKSSLNIKVDINKETKGTIVAAYDDVVSIKYFEDVLPGIWRKKYENIIYAIKDAFVDHDGLLLKAQKLDKSILKDAKTSGGSALQTIVTASYRQAIAAHKCVEDRDGNILFISKENFSNGCAATVDVTYPSIPLFLLYNPELVLGMVRPILKNAKLPNWIYDFSPHDAGRYPILNGNVYGMSRGEEGTSRRDLFDSPSPSTHAPYYYYNKDESIFDLNTQMPVEECGNMLITVFVAAKLLANKDIIVDNMDLFEKWVKYLEKFGQDPGNQLCTDDFAGHLAHNANLAVKSILGIEAYAQMKKYLDDENAYTYYHNEAKKFAQEWEKKANRGDHTCLAFDKDEGWSLKYNLIWDIYFDSKLFSKELFDKETKWYIKQNNEFGTPLDNRSDYTKSDWQVWVTCLTNNKEERDVIYKSLERFINKSKSRVPFTDWYYTIAGKQVGFQARSVQGGCFASILLDKHKA